MDTKKCTKCGEVKELVEFHNRSASEDGKQYSCKECQNKTRAEWSERNKCKRRRYDSGRYESQKSTESYKRSVARKKESRRMAVVESALSSGLMTYLITDGDFLKIGLTKDFRAFEKRLSMLQTGNPRKLSVIATSASNIEKLCHYKFEHLGVLGEWFKMDLEIITFFTENAE